MTGIPGISYEDLEEVRSLLRGKRRAGRTIFLAGNGGSFTTALHWGLDLQKVLQLRTHVLGSNVGGLTAWSNDISYEDALKSEFEVLGREGDVLICLSCSGSSPNIVSVIKLANDRDNDTVLLTSRRCLSSTADLILRVDADDYGLIEDAHLVMLHQLLRRFY